MATTKEKAGCGRGKGLRYFCVPVVLAAVLAAANLAPPLVGQAQALEISNVPLFLSTEVEPNIMLMLDNSGSMQNIVPDAPYDPNLVYLASCPSGNQVSLSAQVETRLVSGSPRIHHNGTDYSFGTDSGQLCFATDTNYLAKLYADEAGGGGTSSYLPGQYTGNYLNWYFNTARDPSDCSNTWDSGRKPCTQSRLMIARKAAEILVDNLHQRTRVGLSTCNSGSGGKLLEIVGKLNPAKRDALKSKIIALTASGATPLAETLADIGDYFAIGGNGKVTLGHGKINEQTVGRDHVFGQGSSSCSHHTLNNASGVSTLPAPIEYSCQKSFAVLLTDGRPQQDQALRCNAYLRDYDGDCPNCSYDKKSGREYESAGSDYLDDVAQALYEMDLRPDLADLYGARNNIATYVIGFADGQTINDPLMQDAADQGGGTFLGAGNANELVAAFDEAARHIMGKVSSAAAIATNSTRLVDTTLIYQARFDSSDWSGEIVAYKIKSDGSVGDVEWDTDEEGKIPSAGERKIFTWNRQLKEGQGEGVPLAWDNLNDEQKTALRDGGTEQQGIDRLSWIRGDQSKEKNKPGGYLRIRRRVLGDIVNSDPAVIGAPDFQYDRLPPNTPGQSTYKSFQTANKNRPKTLYVGANDGMLHAFDACTGVEKFAYLPAAVYANLADLADPDYTHRYFVDGSPFYGDAYHEADEEWKTVLVGTLGGGGRGVFALDITDPDNFSAGKVLWEFTDEDLGHVMGQPVIARMQNGTWAAVFGNGYGSDNHRAFLYIVDLWTGELIKKLDTEAGTAAGSNGLATPALLPNSNKSIDYAYAGDLLGNLWKFDLTHGSNVSQWHVAFQSGTDVSPFFQARNASGQIQPISAPLEIGKHPSGGYMIYFGTGKYFESGDNVVGAEPPIQSFYGLWDQGTPIDKTDRSTLLRQRITHQGKLLAGKDDLFRVTSADAVSWGGGMRGWYLDLIPPPDENGNILAEGERVVTAPFLRHGRVIFTTMIPLNDPCAIGGNSWFMELDAISGARLEYAAFDVNGDRKIDANDLVTVTDSEGNKIGVVASAVFVATGIVKTPTVINGGDGNEYKYLTDSNGNVTVIPEKGSDDDLSGRRSWRQLR